MNIRKMTMDDVPKCVDCSSASSASRRGITWLPERRETALLGAVPACGLGLVAIDDEAHYRHATAT